MRSKNFSIIFISIILYISSVITFAQNNFTPVDSTKQVPSFIQDFESGYNTGIKIVTAPLSFDTKDWVITGAVLTTTTLAYLLDKSNREFWARNQSKSLDKITKVGEFYGEIKNAAIFSGTIYLGGKIIGSKEFSVTGRMLFEGLFFAGLTTTLIKSFSGRSRPYTNDGYNHFKLFQTNNDFTSFPSGHTTVAFTLSSILSNRINNTYVSIGLYALAATTVMQRMYSDNHWLSDTILGAGIGYFIGKAVVMFDDDADNTGIKVNPCFLPNGIGLNFAYIL
ncbi:MAG TPA: PA-phosphatase [Ignavibacteriales bacterium]|nr:PA-phosphatase [Ignavibacteriales bacterium]